LSEFTQIRKNETRFEVFNEKDAYGSFEVIKTKQNLSLPVISVIMSVWNAEKFLEESIHSILSQTFKNFEFIIVNDGSSDNSLNIIHEFLKRDDRIVLLNNETNIGLTCALNRAFRVARGSFIARQDADDTSMAERLEYQVQMLKEKEVDILSCSYNRINEAGVITEMSSPGLTGIVKVENLFKGNSLFHSGLMMRRKPEFIYQEDFKFVQDLELYLRVGKNFKIYKDDKVLANWRQTNQMISKRNKRQQLFFGLKARIRHLPNNFNLSNLFYTFLQFLRWVYISVMGFKR